MVRGIKHVVVILLFLQTLVFRYVRALGALYLRLTGDTLECYNYLEPLLNDYRKLKRKSRSGREWKGMLSPNIAVI